LTPQETAAIVDTGLAVCERALKQNPDAVRAVMARDPRLAGKAGGPIGTLCADPLVRELILGGLDLLLAGAAQPPAAAPQPVQCEPLSIETPRGEPAAMAPDAASAEAPGASPAPAKAP